MRRVRALLEGALEDAGLLLAEADYQRVWSQAREEGQALTSAGLGSVGVRADAFAYALGLSSEVLPRVLGFGALQSRAIARGLGLTPLQADVAAELGGLFNLGIAVFDLICDDFPDSAAHLVARVSRESLAGLLTGQAALPETGDDRVDPLLRVIAAIFQRSRALGADGPVWEALCRSMVGMYEAELGAQRAYRATTAPDDRLLSTLETKSVIPLWTVALLGLLAGGRGADAKALEAHRPGYVAAGTLLWIVDDMVDLIEDWEAGRWSRPWVRWAKHCGGTVPNVAAPAALDALLGSPVPGEEAAALAATVARVRAEAPGGQPDSLLDRCLRATLQSWIRKLPTS